MPSYTYNSGIYTDRERTLFTTCKLYSSSVFYFQKIETIKLFKEYKERIRAEIMSELKLDETHCFLIEESLIDKIKLIICFENIMKANLLELGYLPNIIKESSDEGLEKLRKKQRRGSPILISEYLKYDSYVLGENGYYDLAKLDSTTISFSKLLNSKYQTVIQLPIGIIDFLVQVNKRRNTLHFRPSELMISSEKKIMEWEETIKYINTHVIDKYNSLFPTITGSFQKLDYI